MNDSDDSSGRPPPIAWTRVIAMLRPLRRGLAAMVGLSVGGVLVGLIPPLALGVLVNALVERNDTREAIALSLVIAGAVVVEATAYVLSDGMYAVNASRLYVDLRTQMFAGVRRSAPDVEEATRGLPSRFISDVETVERMTVSLLDTGSMLLVEFGSALIALGLLEPWTLPLVAPLLLVTWIVTRRMQEPAASAGQRRQEELERMTQSIVRELERPDDPQAASRFGAAAENVRRAEVRLGWMQAINRQGSGGLAKLGPIAVVVTAAFAGNHRAGTLISLYLLAQRAFWGFDGVVDLSLAMQSVRGAVARCFALIDTPRRVTTRDPVFTDSS